VLNMKSKRLNKMIILKTILVAVGLCVTVQAAPDMRPNIVWIFSDDHSVQTIGAYGGRLQPLNPTPNIDQLAKEGMRFDRAYVGNSICAPSRATLLTGKHSHLNGKFDNKGGFNHDQQQFQKILQKNGYQTVMVGKIHLSGKMQGFDYWDVLPGQGNYYNPDFINEDGKYRVEGYVSEIITEKAIEWLDKKRDPKKPFMLMVHHKAPHREWSPAPRYLTAYDDVEIPEPDTLFDDYQGRGTAAHQQDMTIEKTMTLGKDLKIQKMDPQNVLKKRVLNRMTDEQQEAWAAAYEPKNEVFMAAKLEGRELVRWKYQRYLKDYLRCIKSVDESVGELRAHLEEMGLADNTIIMYSSDLGFYMGEHGWFDKRFMYEESFRTPLIAHWPGRIKPGSVNEDLVQNIDFAETFLDLAGAPIPDDMQGKSLVPLLKGETPDDWRDSLYYHYYEYPGAHKVCRHEGVFDGRWKLIRYYGKDVPDGEEWELFDLGNDPSEMQNIYNNPENKSQIQAMKKELDRLKEQYNVPTQPPPQN